MPVRDRVDISGYSSLDVRRIEAPLISRDIRDQSLELRIPSNFGVAFEARIITGDWANLRNATLSYWGRTMFSEIIDVAGLAANTGNPMQYPYGGQGLRMWVMPEPFLPLEGVSYIAMTPATPMPMTPGSFV
jgi:hypothetical protein